MTGLPSGLRVEVLFDGLTWTDITDYVRMERGITTSRGREDEFAAIEPGDMTLTLDNSGGEFTPGNASSLFYPNVKSGARIRLVLDVPDFDDPASPVAVPDTYPALYPAPDLYPATDLWPRG